MHNRNFSVVLVYLLLISCSTSKWYSVTQAPAKPIAYIKDGVFVSGEYVRSATVTKIDGKTAIATDQGGFKISTGHHSVMIHCNEANGSYDTKNLAGKGKTLNFNAQTERTYRAQCEPFTHWWIEDLETGKIVAGNKPEV